MNTIVFPRKKEIIVKSQLCYLFKVSCFFGFPSIQLFVNPDKLSLLMRTNVLMFLFIVLI